MPSGPRPRPPNRSCKLTFSGSFEEAQWQNVMWLYLTGSGEITQGDLEGVAGGASNAFGVHFMPVLSTLSLLTTTEVVLYDSVDGDLVAITDSAVAGSDDSASMPANVAACISWQIRSHYRGGHARTYLCGIGAAAAGTTTSWTGSYVGSLSSVSNAFHADLEGLGPIGGGIDTVEHGIVSFQTNNAWRTPPIFRRIISGRADSRVDTQRRRLGRDRIA